MAVLGRAPHNLNLPQIVRAWQGSYCPTVFLGDSMYSITSRYNGMMNAWMRGIPKGIPWAGRALQDATGNQAASGAQGEWSFQETASPQFTKTQKSLDVSVNNTWADGAINLVPRIGWQRVTNGSQASALELVRFGLWDEIYYYTSNGETVVTAEQPFTNARVLFRTLFRDDTVTPVDLTKMREFHARGSAAFPSFTEIAFPGLDYTPGSGFQIVDGTPVETTVASNTGSPFYRLTTEFLWTPAAAGQALGFIASIAKRVDGSGNDLPGIMAFPVDAGTLNATHHSDVSPRYVDAAIDAWITLTGIPKVIVGQFANEGNPSTYGARVKAAIDRWQARIAAAGGNAAKVMIVANWRTTSGTEQNWSDLADAAYDLCNAEGYGFLNLHRWFGGALPSDNLATPVEDTPVHVFSDGVHPGNAAVPSTINDAPQIAKAINWNLTNMAQPGGGGHGRMVAAGIL